MKKVPVEVPVEEIRQLWSKGTTLRDIAHQLNLSLSVVEEQVKGYKKQ